MIQLQSDVLLFETSNGEALPCSAQAVTIELIGMAGHHLEPDLIENAAQAILHYYKHDLGRTTVSLGEFSETLEQVLKTFGLTVKAFESRESPGQIAESSLPRLASLAGLGFELAFFQQLRTELRRQLVTSPRMICFTGLRDSVKLLSGSRRWNRGCRRLSEHIVAFIRDSLGAEQANPTCTVLVK